MKKRFISLFIVLMICFALIPFSLREVIADSPSGGCGPNLHWELNTSTGTLTITGSGAMYDYDRAYKWTWDKYRDQITTVILPNGLTTIGSCAFDGCNRLTAINIGAGVTRIGEYAFWCCRRLKTVTLGNGVDTIEYSAFSGCEVLSDVNYIGTQQMRNNITIENRNSDLLNATWHYLDQNPSVKINWDKADVDFKGQTAYVIANGSAQTPRLTITDQNDNLINRKYYDIEYKENINAGTGYAIITFKNGFSGTARGWFKIYLPPTTETTVENVGKGIRITWAPVDGAAGYVIYRRAWSKTTNGWTTFERWNNVTGTSWIDGSDSSHRVYAGSRYQYGIKAYFAPRVDPVSGATIGGNVGDNYNLGMVGPLKTTVRITTMTMNSVTAGTKQLTAKWTGNTTFTGYELQVATNTAFTSGVKTVKITNPETCQATVKSLTSGKTYYVRVRAYHVFEGMTYYGKWTDPVSCKVK